MTKDNSAPDPNNEDETAWVDETLIETIETLAAGQTFHAEKAQQYGVAKDVMEGFYGLAKKIPAESLQPFRSGFQKYHAFLREKERDQWQFDPSSGALSMAGTASTSAGVMTSCAPNTQEIKDFIEAFVQPPEFWDRSRTDAYAKRLQGLDSELSLVYLGISASFWGSVIGAERNALMQARQLFDHLIGKLAPDEEVRQSPYFHEKEGENPLKIHRLERLKFVAATRIKSKAEGDFLAEHAAAMIAAYDELNLLHARKPIDRTHARARLKVFIAAIEQWIDALDL